MAVILCTNLLSGSTGLDKSVVMTANTLHRGGYSLSVLNFVGPGDGSGYVMPRWPLDVGIGVYPLQTLPARGGRYLHQAFHPVIQSRIPNVRFAFTQNALQALQQLNAALTPRDVVIFTHPLQAMIYKKSVSGEVRQARTVMQIHGDYKVRHPELWPMLIDAKSVVDDVQVVSAGMTKDFVGEFGPQNVTLVPNIHEYTEVCRRPHQGTNVALVGSFQEAKNQLDAVRALMQVRDEKVRLVLWGNSSTDYGRHVRNFADASGVGARVDMPGIGSESDMYGSADIVVVPSRSEGFGYALTEAASHGLPVVAYDYDYGPRDVISDGVSGYIVPVGDVRALAGRIQELAGQPQLRQQMGRSAREVFERSFSPSAVLERYRELLGEVSSESLDIPALFPIEGRAPVALGDVRARTAEVRGRRLGHLVEVRSDTPLRNFQVDNGRSSRDVRALRIGGRYIIPLGRGGKYLGLRGPRAQVLSCETDRPELGRFYLGNTTRNARFEIDRYMSRNADYAPDLMGAGFEVHGPVMNVARHPWHPVTSGSDNFGASINEEGAVRVSNSGNVTAPTVSISGEFDSLVIYDGLRRRELKPPYPYGDLFERVCAAESSGSLLDLTHEGVHPWELSRRAVIANVAAALGMWGQQFLPEPEPVPVPVRDVYTGPKRLAQGKDFRRVLFEFPRKPDGVDWRTAAFQDDDTMIIEYPQSTGYSSVTSTASNRYPIHEFTEWRRTSSPRRVGHVDPTPYEEILSESLGFRVALGDVLTRHMQQFVEERAFWTPVFESIRPEEVVIPSSHRCAGIAFAAAQSGARVSDIQDTLTSRRHPSFWFGRRPVYGATNLYAWSEFWVPRTNAYDTCEIVPRRLPGLTLPLPDAALEGSAPTWDVCVVPQPQVFRRVMKFVAKLASARPDSQICIAPHPDERTTVEAKLSALRLTDRVEIAPVATLDAIRRSTMCVGGYSTSLYEAVALGKPTYVLPVPGHEIMADDIRSGLFGAVTDVADIEPYDVPAHRADIFGALA